jgi:hypothetical protein
VILVAVTLASADKPFAVRVPVLSPVFTNEWKQ